MNESPAEPLHTPRIPAVLIHGRGGRMGGELAKLIDTSPDWREAALEAADIVIDFSSPDGLAEILAQAVRRRLPLVSGTTGLDRQHHRALDRAAADIPVLWSANMSAGINLLFALVARAAGFLGAAADVEIMDRHHRGKRDTPSGTAWQLGERIAAARRQQLGECAVSRDFQSDRPRRPGEIGFSAMRGGSIAGEHTVLFALDDEYLELAHRAGSRRVFARGALRAAHWLLGREPGRYTWDDIAL